MIRRRLLTFLSAFSLILCVGTVGLWVRSYRTTSAIVKTRYYSSESGSAGRSTTLESRRGEITWDWHEWSQPGAYSGMHVIPGLRFLESEAKQRRGDRWLYCWEASIDPHRVWSSYMLLGCGFHSEWYDDEIRDEFVVTTVYRAAFVPYWLVALIFAVLPSLFLRRHRKLRPVRMGLCPTCGYDLRATPDRCPECGTVTAQEARTTT
jgi:hypothetical protein